MMKEEDFLFEKSYECPVCYEAFKDLTVKTGRLKLVKTDSDLRPIYDQLEPLKYDVVRCPHCGYTALGKSFVGLPDFQRKLLKEGLKKDVRNPFENKQSFTFEEALARYRMCLASTIIRRGKSSEKAYISLKMGWLLRSMRESLPSEEDSYTKKSEELNAQEMGFLKNALEGFITARQSESYPICGMDEMTLEYLIAALALRFEQMEVSSRLISNILASPLANRRIKDRARELKEVILEKKKVQE